MSPKAFISFGHESNAHRDLASFLQAHGVKPCLLADEDDGGTVTVLEKFEHHARGCSVAFAILTPDDVQPRSAAGGKVWRARQNVFFEVGWFIRDLGRPRVVLILKGDSVEIPSNLGGVLCLRFTASVFEVTDRVLERLRSLGIVSSTRAFFTAL